MTSFIIIASTATVLLISLLLWRQDIRKEQSKEIEAENEKKALEDVNKNMVEDQAIREKYSKLRDNYPNDWVAIERMRAESTSGTDSKAETVMLVTSGQDSKGS